MQWSKAGTMHMQRGKWKEILRVCELQSPIESMDAGCSKRKKEPNSGQQQDAAVKDAHERPQPRPKHTEKQQRCWRTDKLRSMCKGSTVFIVGSWTEGNPKPWPIDRRELLLVYEFQLR
mmetsp:Transcript_5719/g.35616  ORF Transcript_5719/g.35616 Transcript_5719/m.35616 type:complete len:119 (+) Transcript_5719:176-532(+)